MSPRKSQVMMVGGCQLTFIRMTNYRESNKRSNERQTTTLDVHFSDVTVKRELIKVSSFFFVFGIKKLA